MDVRRVNTDLFPPTSHLSSSIFHCYAECSGSTELLDNQITFVFPDSRMGQAVSCCCPRDAENSGLDEPYGDRSRLIGNADAGNTGLDSTENDHEASYDQGRLINGSVPTGDFLYGNSKGASVPKAPIDEHQVTML